MSDLNLKVVLDRSHVLSTNAETELKYLVKIWPADELRKSGIEPMATSICLVFDCSNSMLQENKLQNAIDSAKMIVDTLSGKQTISLVAFQSKIRVLVSNAEATTEGKQAIKDQIDEIKNLVGGSTNMTDGVREGIAVLSKSKADAKVMILLTDGIADFPETASRAATEATAANIQLYAVGVGSVYGADQLLKMVTPSNGALFGSAESEKIKETFEKLINRIENFVATNAQLTLTFPADVQAGLAYKASPEQAFLGNLALDKKRSVTLKVGNIECDKAYSFMFLVTVPQRNDGGLEVCTTKLVFDVPSANVVNASLEDVPIVIYTKDRTATEELNGEVMEIFRRVSITQLAERFVAASKANNAAQTAKYLSILIKRYEEIGDLAMKNHYESILKELHEKGTITDEMLNASVVASTVVAGGGELPQLVSDDF